MIFFSSLLTIKVADVPVPFRYSECEAPSFVLKEVLIFQFDQIPYLLILCSLLLALLLINGGFRMGINIYKGILAERMLRRLRYQLFERILVVTSPSHSRVMPVGSPRRAALTTETPRSRPMR